MAVEVENFGYMHHPYSVFSHNPLHDLESLWWVGVWFLLCHYKPSNLRDVAVKEHIELIKALGQTLFNNGADRSRRRAALVHPIILRESEPICFPEAVQNFLAALSKFRKQLVTYYEEYVPKEPQDYSFFTPDVHGRCGIFFEDAAGWLPDDRTKLWPWDQITIHTAELEKLERKK